MFLYAVISCVCSDVCTCVYVYMCICVCSCIIFMIGINVPHVPHDIQKIPMSVFQSAFVNNDTNGTS